jgi:hypothetical protein
LAALAVPSGLEANGRPLEAAFHGYGPGGPALARQLAERAVVWDGLGRPGTASLQLAVYPAGARPGTIDSGMTILRRNSVLVAGWPTEA